MLAAILFVAALQPRFVKLEGDPFGLAQGLAALGFTTRHFALYGTVMDAIAVICFVLGCFLFWRKPGDPVVLIVSLTFVLSAATVLPITTVLQYFGGVVVLQLLFLRFTGQRSPLALVISTLTIAALFRPLRNRLQRAIDRRFYRRKYDAQRVIEQFAAVARDEPDLAKLLDELCRAAGETVQPNSIAVWMNSKAEKN